MGNTATKKPKRGPLTPAISRAKKEAFLVSYANCGIITEAANAAEIDRKTFYAWKETDPDFAAAAVVAEAEALDGARVALRTRAIDGWEEPVWHKGEMVGTVRRFSDTCLLFLLKHADHSYRERYDLNVSGEVVHTFDAESVDNLAGTFAKARERAQAIETTSTEDG